MSKYSGSSKKGRMFTLTNPSDFEARKKLNWAIFGRGHESGTEDAAIWANYNFNAYIASQDKFIKVAPVAPEATIKNIYRIYADSQMEATKEKFSGDSGVEVLQKLQLSELLFDGTNTLVEELIQAKEKFGKSINSKTPEGMISGGAAYMQASRTTAEGKGILQNFEKGLRAFSDSVEDIGRQADNLDKLMFGTDNPSGSKNLELQSPEEYKRAAKNIGNIETSQSVKIVKTSHTSAVNLIMAANQMSKMADQLAKGKSVKRHFTKNGDSLDIEIPRISSKGSSDGSQKVEQAVSNWNKIASRFSGTATNYFGTVFEITTAAVLKEGMERLFGANGKGKVSMNFEGSKGGVSFLTSLGKQLEEKSSKTDVRLDLDEIRGYTNVGINLSNKFQSKKGASARSTKVLDGQILNFIELFSDDDARGATLYNGMFNNNYWKTTSSMNLFVSALIADYAIGGLPGEGRVDFIVYQDTIIPLESYYDTLSKVYMTAVTATLLNNYHKPHNTLKGAVPLPVKVLAGNK